MRILACIWMFVWQPVKTDEHTKLSLNLHDVFEEPSLNQPKKSNTQNLNFGLVTLYLEQSSDG